MRAVTACALAFAPAAQLWLPARAAADAVPRLLELAWLDGFRTGVVAGMVLGALLVCVLPGRGK